uniref:Uncharacterized protein n=1 Tax=Heterorhabditis bacteriophora TaxID=37862 RepID=A0A1I7X6W1_HETBA
MNDVILRFTFNLKNVRCRAICEERHGIQQYDEFPHFHRQSCFPNDRNWNDTDPNKHFAQNYRRGEAVESEKATESTVSLMRVAMAGCHLRLSVVYKASTLEAFHY